MSNNVFPTNLTAIDFEVEMTPRYFTKVLRARSGKEVRLSWRASALWDFKLKMTVRDRIAAPAPWAAYSESGIVLKFLDDHKGEWDSFLFNSPYQGGTTIAVPSSAYPGSQVRVRFDADSLKLKRSANGWWLIDSFALHQVDA